MSSITLTVPIEITEERINDLLCGALDAGVGSSWYWIEKFNKIIDYNRIL